MADAAFQPSESPEPIRAPEFRLGPQPVAGPERIRARKPSPEFLKHLRARWESLRNRVQEPTGKASRKLVREVRANTAYMRDRARSYHEQQPLQVLGVAAAAGFVLGLMLGFWKR